MTGPDQPQYPEGPPQYGPPQYGPPPYDPQQYGRPPGPPDSAPPRQRGQLMALLHDRLTGRPEPRLGVSIAGVGIGLVIAGVLSWSLTYVIEGGVSSSFSATGANTDSRRYLGVGLSLVVIVIGYALTVRARCGPLATAGVAAGALAVPVAIDFLTFSASAGDPGSIDAIFWVSVIVWTLSYLFVPGARGHAFYLGLTAVLAWIYAIDKVAPEAFNTRSVVAGLTPLSPSNPFGATTVDGASLAGISLTIGAIYYLVAWSLDRSGRRGAGVVFALAGFPAVAVGVAATAQDLKQVGAGIVLVVVGLALAAYGARYGRRFTTWVWAIGVGVGAVLVLSKLVKAGATVGISLIIAGGVFVAAGWALARALHEPDDVVPASPAPVGSAAASATP